MPSPSKARSSAPANASRAGRAMFDCFTVWVMLPSSGRYVAPVGNRRYILCRPILVRAQVGERVARLAINVFGDAGRHASINRRRTGRQVIAVGGERRRGGVRMAHLNRARRVACGVAVPQRAVHRDRDAVQRPNAQAVADDDGIGDRYCSAAIRDQPLVWAVTGQGGVQQRARRVFDPQAAAALPASGSLGATVAISEPIW